MKDIEQLKVSIVFSIAMLCGAGMVCASQLPGRESHGTFMSSFMEEGRLYLKIPQRTLDTDLLLVSRLSGNAYDFSSYGPGREVGTVHFRFQKVNEFIFMSLIQSHLETNGDLPIYASVRAGNVSPLIHSFKIDNRSKGTTFEIIDITDFFSSGLPGMIRPEKYSISGVDKSCSYVTSAGNFETNVQIDQTITFKAAGIPDNPGNSISIELNHYIVRLPDSPMIPRIDHPSVKFKTVKKTYYSEDENGAQTDKYLVRWRLEPSDWEAFEKGEMVNPLKPIIFYIDPATPVKWRSYIKEGVEVWQKAFERIGLKNAILAKQAPSPEDQPDWNVGKFEYSIIRYNVGTCSAYGPVSFDPRTGEILSAQILLGDEHLHKAKRRYFLETAAANPEARAGLFNDSTMGILIRGIIAHEVGHTLGLYHNMEASCMYPVDSLKSPYFTETHGLSASIMDYAWGNYIAQPGDGVKSFYTTIGEYDLWAIWYGYKPIPRLANRGDETAILTKWAQERDYFETGHGHWDDLGDDAIRASSLGISNLKLITKNLLAWYQPKDQAESFDIYKELIEQFQNYMENVLAELEYSTNPRNEQAFEFFEKHLFRTPDWLVDNSVLDSIGGSNHLVKKVAELQFAILKKLTRHWVIKNHLILRPYHESSHNAYLKLTQNIFGELKTGKPIDGLRRNLQASVLSIWQEHQSSENPNINNAKVNLLLKHIAAELKASVDKSLRKYRDPFTVYHLREIKNKLDDINSNLSNERN